MRLIGFDLEELSQHSLWIVRLRILMSTRTTARVLHAMISSDDMFEPRNMCDPDTLWVTRMLGQKTTEVPKL